MGQISCAVLCTPSLIDTLAVCKNLRVVTIAGCRTDVCILCRAPQVSFCLLSGCKNLRVQNRMLRSVLCTPSLIFCMLAGCRNLRVQNRCCVHCFTPHNPMFCSRLAVPKVIYHGKELLPSRSTWNMFSLLSLRVYNCLLGRTTLVLVGAF